MHIHGFNDFCNNFHTTCSPSGIVLNSLLPQKTLFSLLILAVNLTFKMLLLGLFLSGEGTASKSYCCVMECEYSRCPDAVVIRGG